MNFTQTSIVLESRASGSCWLFEYDGERLSRMHSHATKKDDAEYARVLRSLAEDFNLQQREHACGG